jgi:hypothetical protein
VGIRDLSVVSLRFQALLAASSYETPGTAHTSNSPAPSRSFLIVAYSDEFQTERMTSIEENSKTTRRRPSCEPSATST